MPPVMASQPWASSCGLMWPSPWQAQPKSSSTAHPAPVRRLDRGLVLDAVAALLRPPADHGGAHGQPFGVGVVDQFRHVEHERDAVVELLPSASRSTSPSPPCPRNGGNAPTPRRTTCPAPVRHQLCISVPSITPPLKLCAISSSVIASSCRRTAARSPLNEGFAADAPPSTRTCPSLMIEAALPAGNLRAVQIPVLLLRRAVHDHVPPLVRTLELRGKPTGRGSLACHPATASPG